jgi:hypothetical protein
MAILVALSFRLYYGNFEDKYDSLCVDYSNLESSYNTLNNRYKSIEAGYSSKVEEYDDLHEDYYLLLDDYNDLQYDYQTLQDTCDDNTVVFADSNPPSTVIKDGTIYWNFYSRYYSVITWQVPVNTYRSYITSPKPKNDRLYLDLDGETIWTYDLRGYIQPEFFDKVIDTLTNGNTAYEFVREVVNLKNQLISYGGLESGEYRWSVETLTEGQGNCGDTSILVASLLKSGEEKMNYGLDISLWYCDVDNMYDPQKVNHVIIGVGYSDGSGELIETTSDAYYTYSQVSGWKYEI